jgi:CHAD domain-containing protein
VKARKVKGLDPEGSLADNAARIVAVRLAELRSFSPRVLDPDEIEALHDMRIAAKRLRYVLELTKPALGPSADGGARTAKKLQELLGKIHDCDVMLPRVRDHEVVEVAAHLAARRETLHAQFRRDWRRLESRGFAEELLEGLSPPSSPEPAGRSGGATP